MADNFIKALEEISILEANQKYATKTVNKEDLRENITMVLSQLDDVNNIFAALPPGDRRLMAKKIVATSAIKTNVACDLYCKIARTLKRDDLNMAFSSYTALCLTYKKILEQFNRSFDKWFNNSKLTLYSTKMSQMVIFGMIDEAKMFCKYTTSLFSFCTFEITQHNNISELQEPKKYRKMYIVDKANEFTTNCIRRLADNPYVFSDDLEKASKDIDINITTETGETNMGFVNPANIPASLRHSIGVGTKSFVINIFRWIGEQWVMHKHVKYLKQRKEKEWMEAHVALLQMDLQGKDPNSEEYRKMVTVIDSYNEQIAELDQKISEYEEE